VRQLFFGRYGRRSFRRLQSPEVETVVITASAGSFPGLVPALRTLQVHVEEFPLIDFKALDNLTQLDSALDRMSSYQAVAFTSPRAARAVAERMARRGGSRERSESRPAVWVGGAATAAALGDVLGRVNSPSDQMSSAAGAAAALAQAMLSEGVRGPVLFMAGQNHREELPARLRGEGIQVEEVVCYSSVVATEPVARDVASRATVLVVASPSVAHLLVRACPTDPRPDLVAAGPTTAASAAASGWIPAAVAAQPTTDAVTAAVRSVLARRTE
jgi:uroporphyrinogen-III synthase